MRRAKGFSLVELMIVVLIIGVLAGLAYPGYQRYVYKSHRSDAYAILSRDQGILERCYAQAFKYDGACSAAIPQPQTSENGYYNIVFAVPGANAQSFMLTATAIGTQAGDTNCAALTLDEANKRGPAAAVTNGCWGQ
ncbi:MAG: pilE [Verrucomicrobiaceae bacterium]|nr:pilE [Verrucomicrobiaceae bacterium]